MAKYLGHQTDTLDGAFSCLVVNNCCRLFWFPLCGRMLRGSIRPGRGVAAYSKVPCLFQSSTSKTKIPRSPLIFDSERCAQATRWLQNSINLFIPGYLNEPEPIPNPNFGLSVSLKHFVRLPTRSRKEVATTELLPCSTEPRSGGNFDHLLDDKLKGRDLDSFGRTARQM